MLSDIQPYREHGERCEGHREAAPGSGGVHRGDSRHDRPADLHLHISGQADAGTDSEETSHRPEPGEQADSKIFSKK